MTAAYGSKQTDRDATEKKDHRVARHLPAEEAAVVVAGARIVRVVQRRDAVLNAIGVVGALKIGTREAIAGAEQP